MAGTCDFQCLQFAFPAGVVNLRTVSSLPPHSSEQSLYKRIGFWISDGSFFIIQLDCRFLHLTLIPPPLCIWSIIRPLPWPIFSSVRSVITSPLSQVVTLSPTSFDPHCIPVVYFQNILFFIRDLPYPSSSVRFINATGIIPGGATSTCHPEISTPVFNV